MRVCLAVHEAREAVEMGATHAGALLRIRLVEVHSDGQVEWSVASAREIVVQLLDPWLVAHGRVWIRPRRGRLRRGLAPRAVCQVETLGVVVIGGEILVGQRPGRRDPAVVMDLAKVALPEPEEDPAVELRLSAYVVVLAGVEGLSSLVVPRLACLVLVAHEDRATVPVVGLAAQVVAALEQQDALSRGRKPVGERAAPSAGADDDDVVLAAHWHVKSERSARSTLRSRHAAWDGSAQGRTGAPRRGPDRQC